MFKKPIRRHACKTQNQYIQKRSNFQGFDTFLWKAINFLMCGSTKSMVVKHKRPRMALPISSTVPTGACVQAHTIHGRDPYMQAPLRTHAYDYNVLKQRRDRAHTRTCTHAHVACHGCFVCCWYFCSRNASAVLAPAQKGTYKLYCALAN